MSTRADSFPGPPASSGSQKPRLGVNNGGVLDVVQSVTGPLTPADLGVTLPHEHVFINMTKTTPQDGYLNVWSEMHEELQTFVAAGGSTLIDMTNGELSDYAAPIGWSD